ncbi:MAG TPA: hypothetical protein VIY73_00785, partial [Polyangiaceae bacterium]
MRAMSLGARHAEEAVRAIRALGGHRYVASRLHLIHAFALVDLPAVALSDARGWAQATLGDVSLDAASRDERLWRRCTDAELIAVVEGFWTGAEAVAARASLEDRLARHRLFAREGAPFDEG